MRSRLVRSTLAIAAALVLAPSAGWAQGEVLTTGREGRCPRGLTCPPIRHPGVERVSSEVRATLGDRVVRYEIAEVFVNRGSGLGEADYLLPLPRNAAFRELRLFINGEPVAGEVMSADQARSIYEEIVRRQRDPALVEWMGHGLLRARIFPIAPGERKQVLVRYDAIPEREGDALRVDYFRGSRHSAGPRPRIHPAVGLEGDSEPAGESFTLVYPARFGRAYSPTHRVTLRESGSVRSARVTGEGPHITVLVPVPRSSSISLAALPHAAGRDRHVLLTITPPLSGGSRIARDVTLVLDVSGSMSGEKIRQAREAGIQVLRSLDRGDRFRLIDFASDVRSFRDEFASASSANVAAGVQYLQRLRAVGGTNIEGALEEALQPRSPAGRLPLVLFLTDGMPTVGETRADVLAELVADRRQNRRIFTFGVGADVNVALLEQLAIDGRGTAHFVRSEESIEHAVSIVASRLAEPVLTDVRVQVSGGLRLSEMYPRLPTDVFAGQDLVLLARYDGTGRAVVRVSGRAAGRDVSAEFPVLFPANERRNDFVPRLWATRRIGHLVAERRRSNDPREIDSEIRQLALRYGLPSQLSSYLVLEPGAVSPVPVARGPAPAPPPPVAPQGGADLAERAANSQLRLSEVVVSGKVATTGERAFESARAASASRDAATLTDASGAANVRTVAGRSFALTDSIWVQISPAQSTNSRVVRIKAYSSAYFRVMDAIPDLRSVLSLGPRVRAHGRGVTVEVGEDGVEQLSERALRELERDW